MSNIRPTHKPSQKPTGDTDDDNNNDSKLKPTHKPTKRDDDDDGSVPSSSLYPTRGYISDFAGEQTLGGKILQY